MSHALLNLGFDRWEPGLEEDDWALDTVLETEPAQQPERLEEASEHSYPSSSSGESSGVDALLVNSGGESAPIVADWSKRPGGVAAEGLFMHNLFSTVHCLAAGSLLRFRCGRILKASFTPLAQAQFAWPRCKVCFPDQI